MLILCHTGHPQAQVRLLHGPLVPRYTRSKRVIRPKRHHVPSRGPKVRN